MSPSGRRRSIDSSSSSSSSSSDSHSHGGGDKHKGKKDKKKDKESKGHYDSDEKKKKEKKYGVEEHKGIDHVGAHGFQTPGFGQHSVSGYAPQPGQHPTPGCLPPASFHEHPSPGLPESFPPRFSHPEKGQTPASASYLQQQHPPAYTPPNTIPPAGYRLPLTTTAPFPGPQQASQPPCFDLDGVSPVFFGSAIFQSSVHPCKIAPHLMPPCRIPYGGVEYEHHGRYDLLPFTPDTMELVHTSYGQIPPGRRPVEGGYEEDGAKLYHAVAFANGTRTPGKTGEHLGGANVPFGGQEIAVNADYEILCWR